MKGSRSYTRHLREEMVGKKETIASGRVVAGEAGSKLRCITVTHAKKKFYLLGPFHTIEQQSSQGNEKGTEHVCAGFPTEEYDDRIYGETTGSWCSDCVS